jgi:hypothetical protein
MVNRRMLAALMSALMLSACNFSLTADVYLSDLLAAVDNPEKQGTTTATLSLQMASKDTCIEKGAEAIDLVSTYFMKVGDGRCRDLNIESYLDIPVELPVFTGNSLDAVKPNDQSLVAVAVIEEQGYPLTLALALSSDRLDKLRDDVKKKYYQSVNRSDISFGLTINNDGRADAEVQIMSAWAGDDPVPDIATFTIPRRGTLAVRLSDVSAGALMTQQVQPVMMMAATK